MCVSRSCSSFRCWVLSCSRRISCCTVVSLVLADFSRRQGRGAVTCAEKVGKSSVSTTPYNDSSDKVLRNIWFWINGNPRFNPNRNLRSRHSDNPRQRDVHAVS